LKERLDCDEAPEAHEEKRVLKRDDDVTKMMTSQRNVRYVAEANGKQGPMLRF
jgi:hypothetical protein